MRFINGLAHLGISRIPPKFLKIINFFGFNFRGREDIGFDQINKSAFEYPGMFAQGARMFLLAYWTYAEPHGGVGAIHNDVCIQILKKEIEEYPNVMNF